MRTFVRRMSGAFNNRKKEPVRFLPDKRNLTGSKIFGKSLLLNPFHVRLVACIYFNVVTGIYKQGYHNSSSCIHCSRFQ